MHMIRAPNPPDAPSGGVTAESGHQDRPADAPRSAGGRHWRRLCGTHGGGLGWGTVAATVAAICSRRGRRVVASAPPSARAERSQSWSETLMILVADAPRIQGIQRTSVAYGLNLHSL